MFHNQNNLFGQLELEHKKLLRRQRNKDFSSDELVEKAQDFLKRILKAGRSIEDENQRIQLQSFARYWGLYFYKNTKQTIKKYPKTFLEDFQGNQEEFKLNNLSDFDELKEDEKKFYGRKEELACLEEWIIKEQCRLAVILGTGGVGKTSLVANLSEKIKDKFSGLIWRSLRTAPYIDDILIEIINSISEQNDTKLSGNIENKVSYLIKLLNDYRYLIILDNFESIIQAGTPLSIAVSDNSQRYQEKYKGYEELIRRITTSNHQSCLLITSREKLEELSTIINNNKFSAHTLSLKGLSIEEGIEMLEDLQDSSKEYSEESKHLMSKIVKRFNGNPLALQFAALRIRREFAGDIEAFDKTKQSGLLGDIDDLIDEHFSRLSKQEQAVMYWIAIAQEKLSIDKLTEDFREEFESPDKKQIINNLIKSLKRRFIIEKDKNNITLQSVVAEYVIRDFIERVKQEIVSEKVDLINNHFLFEAKAKEYLRESQIRLILEPVTTKLLVHFKNQSELLSKKLRNILESRRKKPGYAAGNIINLLIELIRKTDSENAVLLKNDDFSDLFIWQTDFRDVNLHNVNFARADLSKSVFTQSFASVSSVAFSPDGTRLTIGDANGEISLWRVEDGQQLFWPCQEDSSWVLSVAFSPNGERLASGSDDYKVRLLDANTGKCLNTLKEHDDWVSSVAFSPNGERLASGSYDRTIKLWDVTNVVKPQLLHSLEGHEKRIWSVAFSPDNKTLASGSDDKTVKIWDVNSGKCRKNLSGHDDWVSSVAFSPDGQTLASGSADKTVIIWDVSTIDKAKCLQTLSAHTATIRSVAFSPNDKILASGSEDKTVKIWDVSTIDKAEWLQTLSAHTATIRSVAFSPNGQTLASGSDDHSVKMWSVKSGELDNAKCYRTLQGYSNWVWSVAFSPDGQTLASAHEDQKVRIWNVATGECLEFQEKEKHENWIWSVAFSKDGTMLASASEDKTVKIWDVNSGGECLNTLKEHDDWVRSVAFSPTDNEILASGSDDKTVKIWNVATDACLCLKTLEGHNNWVNSIAFSPDGQTLASGSDDKTVKIWDIATGKCLKTLKGHNERIWSVAFSPNGKRLASGSDDKTVKIWDVNSWECLGTVKEHKDGIPSVAFCSDETFASGSRDGTIKLWKLKIESGNIEKIDQLGKPLRLPRPYEGTNIKDSILTDAQKESLKSLGAVEDPE